MDFMRILSRPLAVTLVALGTAALLAACSTPGAEERTIRANDLVGVWVLDQTFDSPEQPFISFVNDNTWSASDGCNRVQGTWELGSDGELTTTAGPSTLMACEGAQLPLAVTRADRAEIEGDVLTIHSSFDSTETDLIRSTDSAVGPQGLPIGYWVEEPTPESPFLSIAADGRFTGNDGCNTLVGTWVAGADDQSVDFGGVAVTRMACEGVDQWLSGLARGRVIGGVMTIEAADGTVLGQLTGR